MKKVLVAYTNYDYLKYVKAWVRGARDVGKWDDDIVIIEKLNSEKPISLVYYNNSKSQFYIKRFLIGISDNNTSIIPQDKDNFLEFVTSEWRPQLKIISIKQKGKDRKEEIINIEKFISVKGIKSIGNKLTSLKVKEIDILDPLPYDDMSNIIENTNDLKNETELNTIENEKNNQISLDL